MCLFQKAPDIPKPPALPPTPVAPPPPPAPTPAPESLKTQGVNTQVKRAKSEKEKNPLSKGTGALRIPLKNTVNIGSKTPEGGLNV